MEPGHHIFSRQGDPTRLHVWWPPDALVQETHGPGATIEPLRVEWYDGDGNRLEGPPAGWSAEPWKEREIPEIFHEVRPGVFRAMLIAPEGVKEKLRGWGYDVD